MLWIQVGFVRDTGVQGLGEYQDSVFQCETWRICSVRGVRGDYVSRANPEGDYSCGNCEECSEKGLTRNGSWRSVTEINRKRRTSKLTEGRVAQLRSMLAEGHTHKVVAKEFGIGVSLVGKIGRFENWA